MYVLVFVWVYVYENVGALMIIYINEYYTTCEQINVCINIYVVLLLRCQFNMYIATWVYDLLVYV